jgi:tRNA threonylcarbamoyladenosine biosynthesis protein TsaB
MKVLSVDTSSMVAAVAVMEDTKLLGEYLLNHKKTHSQKLMPMINSILNDLELAPQDIDLYAASTGPGSFTGLRIGVTTIKAIAYAAGKPVIGIPTLDALAFNIPLSEALICPIMDARNNQVYTALYKWDKNAQVKATEYLGIPVTELVQLIKGKNQKVIFTGDAVELHSVFLKNELGGSCEFVPGSLQLQRASSVAYLALARAASDGVMNSFDLVPFYLRKSQAEREYEKKAGCTLE